MMRNTLALLVVAGLSAWSTSASACGNPATVWGQGSHPNASGVVGSVTVGQPSDASPVRRCSGKCGANVTGPGNFTEDGSSGGEFKQNQRFAVYTGVTGGTVKVFSAKNSANTEMFSASFTGTQFTFTTTGGSGSISGILPNKWYQIELDWDRTLAVPAMNVSVAGGGTFTPQTTTVTGVGATDSVDYVQLGWISGTATGSIGFDAYESRRATTIGFLCFGDVNGDVTLNVGDRVALTNEILNPSDPTKLGNGQSDCNTDGLINVGDRVCLTNRILAAAVCP